MCAGGNGVRGVLAGSLIVKMVGSGPKGHLGVPLAHGEGPMDGNGADLDQGVSGHPKLKPKLKTQTCPDEHPFGLEIHPRNRNPRISEV
jgi:hypothetical protein